MRRDSMGNGGRRKLACWGLKPNKGAALVDLPQACPHVVFLMYVAKMNTPAWEGGMSGNMDLSGDGHLAGFGALLPDAGAPSGQSCR